MRLDLTDAKTGETVLSIDANDDRLATDDALIAETAEQALADAGLDYRLAGIHGPLDYRLAGIHGPPAFSRTVTVNVEPTT